MLTYADVVLDHLLVPSYREDLAEHVLLICSCLLPYALYLLFPSYREDLAEHVLLICSCLLPYALYLLFPSYREDLAEHVLWTGLFHVALCASARRT
jgi:hypothetical protein